MIQDGERRTAAEYRSQSHLRLRLWRAGRDRRRGPRTGARRSARASSIPRPSRRNFSPRLSRRAAGSRSGDPHHRRAAPVQFPAVAVGLCGIAFVGTLWPDFGRANLFEALHVFAQRERRFGAVHRKRWLEQRARDRRWQRARRREFRRSAFAKNRPGPNDKHGMAGAGIVRRPSRSPRGRQHAGRRLLPGGFRRAYRSRRRARMASHGGLAILFARDRADRLRHRGGIGVHDHGPAAALAGSDPGQRRIGRGGIVLFERCAGGMEWGRRPLSGSLRGLARRAADLRSAVAHGPSSAFSS